jgi:lactose/L-arabinose transport system substrate-binding protein
MKIAKKFLIFIISLIFTFSIFGCTKKTKVNNNDKKEFKGNITIATAGIYTDILNSIAEDFIKENPKVKINVKSVDSDIEKMPSDYVNDNKFDLVQIPRESCSYITNKYSDKLMNLTSLVNSYKSKGYFFNSFINEIVNEEDNSIYCMPWSIRPIALYYRKDIFKKAGINPENIKTWDNFIEAGKKINEVYNGNVKIIGLKYEDSYDILLCMLNQLGGQFYDSKGNVYLYNDKLLKVLNIQKKMINEDIVLNLEDKWNDRIFYLKTNQLATVPYSLRYKKVIKDCLKDQSGNWGIMKLPAFENGGNQIANYDGAYLAISKNTKNKDLSIEFMKYIVMNNNANKVLLKYGVLSGYRPFYNNSVFENKDDYFQMQVERYFANIGDSRTLYYGKNYPYVKENIKYISLKNLNKEKNLKSFLELKSKKLDEIIYKQKK